MNDNEAFARLVDALHPWHAHLVFVGGWGHQLHRLHPGAGQPTYQVIRTDDADIAIASRARLAGNIADALKNAGFHEEFSGDDAPPITHYHIGESRQGFYAEFLTPLSGSGVKRRGKADVTLNMSGVTAQKLRHLDLLLVAPWQLTLAPDGEVPVARSATILVANPVTFIVQKLLIHSLRRPDKRAQDALYVHDTVQLFGEHLASLRQLWLDVVQPAIPPQTAAPIPQLVAEQFGSVNDVIRRAVRIPQDRAMTPQTLAAACAAGLNDIFGEGT